MAAAVELCACSVVAGGSEAETRLHIHCDGRYCVQHLTANLLSDPAYPANPSRALTNAFIHTDNGFLETARASHPPLDDGTTAVVSLVLGDTIYVANGTSHACMCMLCCSSLTGFARNGVSSRDRGVIPAQAAVYVLVVFFRVSLF